MATSYPQEVIMHCFINNIFFICKKMFYIYPYVNKTHSLERLCTYIVHSSLEQVINIYGRVWRVEINVYNFIFFKLAHTLIMAVIEKDRVQIFYTVLLER